jgi:hypothetical protein
MLTEQQLNEARLKLAGFLKQKRKEKGLTLQQLADCIGIMQPLLARIKFGKFWISTKLLLQFC